MECRELRVDEWLRAKDELLEGLDGEVERRGTMGVLRVREVPGVGAVRTETGRMLPFATRSLRLAVLSLRFGPPQPP